MKEGNFQMNLLQYGQSDRADGLSQAVLQALLKGFRQEVDERLGVKPQRVLDGNGILTGSSRVYDRWGIADFQKKKIGE